MKNRAAMRIMAIIMCYMLHVTFVYGAGEVIEGQTDELPEREETEPPVYDWSVLTGEILYLPEKGEVLEFDETLFSLQEDGGFAANASGEGEIVVRYRIQIEEVQNQTEQEAFDEDTIKEQDADELYQEENADELYQKKGADDPYLKKKEVMAEPERVDEKQQDSDHTDEEIRMFPFPEVKAEEEKIMLTYDKRYDRETVPKDFEPVIWLPQDKSIEIVSCSVNGVEESYSIKDNQLIIDKEILTEGKNRIIITVRDEQGDLIVMDPWEFMVQAEGKKQNKEEIQEAGEEIKEQKLSLGMSFLIVGTALVYYEKKRYINRKESCQD